MVYQDETDKWIAPIVALKKKKNGKKKMKGGGIPDGAEITDYIIRNARDAGVINTDEEEELGGDYDYEGQMADYFRNNYDEVISGMREEFDATEDEVLEGLRDWVRETSAYYFGWLNDMLDGEESEEEESEYEEFPEEDEDPLRPPSRSSFIRPSSAADPKNYIQPYSEDPTGSGKKRGGRTADKGRNERALPAVNVGEEPPQLTPADVLVLTLDRLRQINRRESRARIDALAEPAFDFLLSYGLTFDELTDAAEQLEYPRVFLNFLSRIMGRWEDNNNNLQGGVISPIEKKLQLERVAKAITDRYKQLKEYNMELEEEIEGFEDTIRKGNATSSLPTTVRRMKTELQMNRNKLLQMKIDFKTTTDKMKGGGNLPSCLTLTAERGAGKKNLNMFELFKGTGSVGKVAKRIGYNVISLDFDPIYTPDIETDILKWDYKKWAEENDFRPDYIWSSPPCNTYSTLAYRLKERDTKTAEPKSARAREGTAILHKTLEIIKYFQSKNPKMLYTIENPRGMMRHDKLIKKLPNRETTLYCLYGDFKRKPTDFWSNFPMNLKPHDSQKCKGKNVVSNLANLPTIEQRYSIPSKLMRKILTEAKEQYGDEPLMGAGFFGDIWNAAKAVGKKVVGTIRNVVSTGVRQDYPPYVRRLLSEIGDKPITEIYVRREPIASLLNKALNFISRGKWNEEKSKYSYDSLFHLGIEIVVRMSENNNINKRYVIEKNEVIEISPAKSFGKDTEIMPVSMNGTGHTTNGLLVGAKAIMGGKFFPYDPFYNNCQDFIMAILTGSGLGNTEVYSFVKQPIEQIAKELPAYTGFVAKTLTDLGGLANTAIYGQGGINPSRKFANQLKRCNVNPADYLAEAKRIAKKKGLPSNMLGFSSDDKHKLQIPNADGKIIRFGASGLNDYILYTLSKNPKADDHRRRYLARATKIKGNWASDPFSPNSLAINILWMG